MNVLSLVDGRIQMLRATLKNDIAVDMNTYSFQIRRRSKISSAKRTVVVRRALLVMLLKPIIVLEDLQT